MTQPDYSHITNWIFDLDNCLYPADCDLFALIDARMKIFIGQLLNIDESEAYILQKTYFHQYGTSLAGLMRHHQVEPRDFLDFVHDISMYRLSPDPQLREKITALPGRKWIFTNGDGQYAQRVLTALGLNGIFSGLHDVIASDFIPKPEAHAYEKMLENFGLEGKDCLFVDDMARNAMQAKNHDMMAIWLDNGSEGGNHKAENDKLDLVITNIHHWLDDILAQ